MEALNSEAAHVSAQGTGVSQAGPVPAPKAEPGSCTASADSKRKRLKVFHPLPANIPDPSADGPVDAPTAAVAGASCGGQPSRRAPTKMSAPGVICDSSYRPVDFDALATGTPASLAPDTVDTAVKIFKVKQPWAAALVEGYKTCENRGYPLSSVRGRQQWVVIASSRSRPTSRCMVDLRQRLVGAKHGAALSGPVESIFDYGCILGMVRVLGCYRSDALPCARATVWHNPPDVAWIISEAIEFHAPVQLEPSDKFQTQVCLQHRPAYKEAIRERLVAKAYDHKRHALMDHHPAAF